MNLAPIITEDLSHLEQTLRSRIGILRKQIANKQKLIEDRVNELRKIQTEDVFLINQSRTELLNSVNRFSAEIQEAQKNPRFDASTIHYLLQIHESLYLQLDQLGGPFAGFPRGGNPTDPGVKHQEETGDEEFSEKSSEERSDHFSAFTEEDAGQGEDNQERHDRDDFADEEFIRMMREFERKQRLKDPFSQESLAALRQTSDDPDLRKLYLHLAKQIHPDLAGTAEEAAQRTRLMQQLSHAYRMRDFAALLTLQETIVEQGLSAVRGATDAIGDDSITLLRTTVEKLEAQLTALKKHSNRMSRSSTGRLLKQRREYGSAVHEELLSVTGHLRDRVDSVTLLIQQAAAGSLKMRALRKRCDEVICLDDWDDTDDMDIDVELDALAARLMNEIAPKRPRRGRGRKRR